MILGRILLGVAIAAFTAGAVAAVVLYVKGKITKAKIRAEMVAKEKLSQFVVNSINEVENVVTVKDIFDDQEYEIHGDGIGYDIDEGGMIYV